MKHLFFIDDKTKTGKYLLPLLKELTKSGNGISHLSEDEVEDKLLLQLMRQGLRSGMAPRKRVMQKLGIK